MIEQLRPLTQEQRQAARQAARQAIVRSIGPRPVREQFAHHTIGKYPSSVTRLISLLCIILLLAAFTPSAIRLYVIGSQTFGQAVDNAVAMTAVGLATVLSAEVGQVVFSLALVTLRARCRAYCRILATNVPHVNEENILSAAPDEQITSGRSYRVVDEFLSQMSICLP
jgi:hypothetical protein